MAIITFWNDGKKETGQSMTIAAIATTLAINYNYKILIINSKHDDKSLEWAFDSKKNVNVMFTKGKTDLETGLSGVSKAIMSNKTSPEIITNYTKIILNNLELLTEKNVPKNDFDRYIQYLKDMAKLANRYYDIILVDLEGNLENSVVKQMLEISQINVVTLVQNINVIDRYIEQKANSHILTEDNIIISINKYDEKSKYTVKNVSKYIKEKKVYAIPYNTLYGMESGEGRVADYFIKFKGVNQSNINAPFIRCVQEEAEGILEAVKSQPVKII